MKQYKIQKLVGALLLAWTGLNIASFEELPKIGENWVLVANLVIWTGLFLFLRSLHNKVRDLEKDQ